MRLGDGANRIGRSLHLAALVATALMVPLGTAAAQEGARLDLSLEEAIAIALHDNRAIRSAYLDRIVQRFDLRVAERKFTPSGALAIAVSRRTPERRRGESGVPVTSVDVSPTVDLLVPTGARFGFEMIAGRVRTGGDTSYSPSFAATVVQPLLRNSGFAVNNASVVTARIGEQINRLRLRDTVASTVVAVTQAYRTLIQAQQQLTIARDALNRAVDLYEVNVALLGAGRVAATELVTAESNITNQDIGLVDAENGVDQARLALLQILAMDASIQLRAIDKVEPREVALTLPPLLTLAFDKRTDWQGTQLNREIGKINLLLAEDGRLWELNLAGGVNTSGFGPRFGEAFRDVADTRAGWNLGLQLRIPIGDLSLEQRVVSARTALRRTDLSIDDQRQQIEIAVRNALRSVDSAWRSYQLALVGVELSAQKLEIERQRLAVGRSSNFQVVTFEDDLSAARRRVVNVAIAYLNALTQLDQTLGTTLDAWRIDVSDTNGREGE